MGDSISYQELWKQHKSRVENITPRLVAEIYKGHIRRKYHLFYSDTLSSH